MIRRTFALACVALVAASCTGGKATSAGVARAGAGGTLTVGLAGDCGAVFYHLDPQNEFCYDTWELMRCCLLRTLMSYGETSDVTGTQPQPDLAAGTPELSTDGLTWTFRLRPGLHYGPPLQNVPITSPDIRRAILRAGRSVAGPNNYLSSIVGYDAYQHRHSETIAGLETPDPLTLVVKLDRPDASLPYLMALETTAPIPPSPADPSAPLGVATGHDSSGDPHKVDGYGLVLVSSGPYMIEGEGAVDFSKPPADQTRPTGFTPWTYDRNGQLTGFGSLTLVRNPSWDPSTDTLRPALPDRIVVRGGTPDALFRQFREGRLDMVFDAPPPPDLLHRYLSDPSLRPDVQSLETENVIIADFNLAQPPFDDLAVRRAVAFALNRRAMLAPIRRYFGWSAVIAEHYVPDIAEDGLASGWNPFPDANGAPDMQAALRALAASRYRVRNGRCADPACRHVRVLLHGDTASVAPEIRHDLAGLGIRGVVTVPDDFWGSCQDPSAHVGLCIGAGWFPDYPSMGDQLLQMFGESLSGELGNSRLGATPAQLAAMSSPVRSVPNVDPEILACDREVAAAAIACWTRLDQYVVTQVMPSVPIAFGQTITLTSPAIASFVWDQSDQEPALDRLALATGSTGGAGSSTTTSG